MEKLIGLSLSFCIKDIIAGKVDINDVAFFSTGTCARTPEDWADVELIYRETYWGNNPELASSILHSFLDRGLILQPRLEGNHPVPFTEGVNWKGVQLSRYWMIQS